MRRLQIVIVALLMLLVMPAGAYAQESIDYPDTFMTGLSDTVKPDEVEVKQTEDENLRAGDETPDDSAYGNITAWVSSLRLTYGNATFGPDGWYRMARTLLASVVLPVSVTLVFLWWGVRKSIRMLFAAWRKGKSNV